METMIGAMAQDAQGNLFGTGAAGGDLYRIDKVSGHLTQLTSGKNFQGITFDSQGTLFAFTPGHLLTIDAFSGTTIGDLPSSGTASNLAFDNSGVLYALDGGLQRIDTATGQKKYIGSQNSFVLAFGSDGTMYAVNGIITTQRIVAVNLATGYGAIVSYLSGTDGSLVLCATGELPSSVPVSTTPKVTNLSATPNPVVQGTHFSLTASVTKRTNVSHIVFYADSNGNQKFDHLDQRLGNGSRTEDEWALGGLQSRYLKPGAYVYFARAIDRAGVAGVARGGTLIVNKPKLSVFVENAKTQGLVTGYSPYVAPETSVLAALRIRNDLKLWLTVYPIDSGGAVHKPGTGIAGKLAARNLVDPSGLVSYLGSFTAADQSVSMRLAFDFSPWTIALNILDYALAPLGPSPADLLAIAEDLESLPGVAKALAQFTPTPKTAIEWIEAGAKAANDVRAVVADKTQRDLLQVILKRVGINASSSTLKSVLSASTLYAELRKMVDEVILYVKTADADLQVTFTAEPLH